MKNLATLIASILLLASCATSKYSSPRGIVVGMAKSDVIELIGKSHKVVNVMKTPEGIYETIEYVKQEKGMDDELFVYYFFNDELTEWHTEVLESTKKKKSQVKPDTSHRRP